MSKPAPRGRSLSRLDRPVALGILVFSATAAAMGVAFAAVHKPYVLLHTLAAYALIWALLVSYGVAYRARRRLLAIIYWLTALCFTAVVVFVHLDDMPARMIWNDGADPPGMVVRPEAPFLGAAAVLDAAWALLLTIHAMWLQMRRRPQATAPEEAPVEAT